MTEQVLPWITSTLGDIARFLLARIAEDEAVIRSNWAAWDRDEPWALEWASSYALVGMTEQRALAECWFKRAQIRHVTAFRDASDVPLREMALLYAKHPDYRDDWAIIHMGDYMGDDHEWWLARP